MKKHIIMGTDQCYEGFNNEEECTQIDSRENLYNEINVDDSSIEFSSDSWKDEKDYFFSMLDEEVTNYEKRYKTTIKGIALIGTVGVWTGKHKGGKVYDIDNMKSILEMDVDDIDVSLEDRAIVIGGHHHDGSHYMKIHFITDNKLKSVGLFNEYEENGIEELNYIDAIDKLAIVLKPLRLGIKNGFFNVTSEASE